MQIRKGPWRIHDDEGRSVSPEGVSPVTNRPQDNPGTGGAGARLAVTCGRWISLRYCWLAIGRVLQGQVASNIRVQGWRVPKVADALGWKRTGVRAEAAGTATGHDGAGREK